jgi:cytochrome c oxidase assembly factor CtaG
VPSINAMHGGDRLGFTLHNVLTRWETSPFALVMLALVVVAGAWYVQSAWSLSARGRTWSWKRTTSFLTGLVLIDLAFQSPVASFTMGYFQAHMIQHLLLMVSAPPLIALGAPMTLALQTSGRSTKVRLLRVLNSRAFRWWSHPVPTAVFYYISMFVFFLTSAVNVAMTHMWLMDVINVAFLVASLHFWWPIVGVDQIPHWPMGHGMKMVALLIGVPIESFLALALLSETRPVASMYTVGGTHAGAAILWIGTELFTFLALIPVFLQWIRVEGRRTARIDAELDAAYAAAGTTLTPVIDDASSDTRS